MAHKGYKQRPVTQAELDSIPTASYTAPSKRSADILHGLTIKQETFANLVAMGHSYASAYRTAYDVGENTKDHTIYRDGHGVAHNPKVRARISELVELQLEEHSARQETRAARVVSTLEKVMTSAKTDSARLRAAELLGKSVGLFVDRVSKEETTHASIADLEKQLGDILKSTQPVDNKRKKGGK